MKKCKHDYANRIVRPPSPGLLRNPTSPRWGEGWGEGDRMRKAHANMVRRLRRRLTNAERLLWFRLRDRRLGGWKFKRQFPIDRYIVDLFCADAHLIIELDGGRHALQTKNDASRTKILEAMGYLVLRFWNNDVMRNIEGVLEEIMTALGRMLSEPPHPEHSPLRREGIGLV